jgi:hypothetical protein
VSAPDQSEKATISQLQRRLYVAKSCLRGAQAIAGDRAELIDIKEIVQSAADAIEDVADELGEH